MAEDDWSVSEAKAKFSEVIERARSQGPQIITRKGRMTAVVVSVDEWQRKTKREGTLADFLAASPFKGSGIRIRRLKGRPRRVDL